jgi:hypothetical protein
VELKLVKGQRFSYNKELNIDNKALVKAKYSFINEIIKNII